MKITRNNLIMYICWTIFVIAMILCAGTLSALSSSNMAIGVIRFKPTVPPELTNLVPGESFDLFTALPSMANVDNGTYAVLSIGDSEDEHKYGPYVFENLEMFENKTISRIRIPVAHISNSDAYFTVYVISNEKGTFKPLQTFKLTLTPEQVNNFNPIIGMWATFDNLNIRVGEGETLAFGSGLDTITTLYTRVVTTGRGFYGCGSQYTNESKWWDLTDQVSLMFDVYAYSDLLTPSLGQDLISTDISECESLIISDNSSPWIYNDLTMFTNKVITKIIAPVKGLSDYTDAHWTVSVVKTINGTRNILRSYTLEMTTEQINDFRNHSSTGQWVEFANLNIFVGEDETLAFTSGTDTILMAYGLNINSGTHGFYGLGTDWIEQGYWRDCSNHSLLFDVYGMEYADEKLVFEENAQDAYTIDGSNTTNLYIDNYVWKFTDETANYLSGKTVTKITVPALSINNTNDAFITVHVIDKNVPQISDISTIASASYKLSLSQSQINQFTSYSFITFDNLSIDIGENETLAFCSPNDTITLLYAHASISADQKDRGFIDVYSGMNFWDISQVTLPFDIYVQQNNTYEQLLQKESAKEVFKNSLKNDYNYSVLYGGSNANYEYGPYTYHNSSIFENKTITKIVAPVFQITNEADAYWYLYVVDLTSSSTSLNIVNRYKIALTSDQIEAWRTGSANIMNGPNLDPQMATWMTFDRLNIQVGENQTLAFGGAEDTVTFLYSENLYNSDRTFNGWGSANFGQFYNDKNMLFDVYGYNTNDVSNSTLMGMYVENEFTSDFLSSTDYSVLDYTEFSPWCYQDLDMFENSIITKIVVPVRSIEVNTDATFAVHTISINDGSIKQTYNLTMTQEEVAEFKTNYGATGGWVTFDNLSIAIRSNETLAFTSPNDTISTSYYNGVKYDKLTAYSVSTEHMWADYDMINMMFGVYGTKVLSGKTMSILGDSISTFAGYSNNTTYNSTIGSNAVAYPTLWPDTPLAVEDTWWMQTINQLGMELCVNNSWSGSFTLGSNPTSSGWYSRSTQLHNDHTGVRPDIIAVYMGTNDFYNTLQACNPVTDDLFTRVENGSLTTPTTFDEAYALMINKIIREYGAYSDVFCFTVPESGYKIYDDVNIEDFNAVIRAVAEHYGCPVVDLWADSGINAETAPSVTYDQIHPNATGMDMMSDCFVNKILEYYSLGN